ncbi:hypothetical protein FB45DRAFT_1130613 [Roridomyces roridus]|uniref:F-box domain-containing protein n=1 Tax=Roridomyces roridus TaxID=1738132 RepID=A0AAD7F817_9AGAR|nr:hypothetical protein FB45DRAFT_1130613 [Roridomyces roridus]
MTRPLELRPFDHDSLFAARVDALLRSNEPPEESDIQKTQKLISDYRHHLDELDDELRGLNDRLPVLEDLHAEFPDGQLGHQISGLKERCALLEADRATSIARSSELNYPAILSPLRRMPPEILREIMRWTVPTAVTEVFPGGVGLRQSPWNIACVSQRWRAVALSMPSLWSLILWNYNRYNLPIQAIKIQVQRANMLRVNWHGNVHPSEFDETKTSTAVQTLEYLIEHSPRWEESMLQLLTAEMVHLLPALRDRIPSLRMLVITWADGESEEKTRSLDCFETASSLVRLVLHRRYHPLSTPFVFPGNQLTQYQGVSADWATQRAILSASPSLIQASIHISVATPQHWGEPIRLGRLLRLSVSDIRVLSYLSAPVLEHIVIRFRHSSNWFEMGGTLDRFLTSHSSTIRTVVLESICDAKLAGEILQRVPNVKNLVLIGSCNNHSHLRPTISDELVALLSHFTGVDSERRPTLICPRLSRFVLVFKSGYPFSVDYQIICQALETRLRLVAQTNASPLQAVMVAFESSSPRTVQQPNSKALCRLKKLGSQGLKFLYVEGASARCRVEAWTCRPRWHVGN